LPLGAVSQEFVLFSDPEKRLARRRVAHDLRVDPYLFGAGAPALDALQLFVSVRVRHGDPETPCEPY